MPLVVCVITTLTQLTVDTTSLYHDHYRYCQFLILPLHFNCFCRQKYYFSLSVGFHLTYIVIIGGEATQNCDMDNRQRRQPPASNGEAICEARAEEITPSVAGVRRRNNTAPERRSTRRRSGLTPGCSTGPAAFNVAGGRNSIDLGPRTLSRGTGIRTNKYFQHHYHQDRSSGHHRVAASAPRNNDVDRTGSRRAPCTTS